MNTRYSKVYYPPSECVDWYHHGIFLAGSIEMDTAENCQDEFIKRFQEVYPDVSNIKERGLRPYVDKFSIMNPRRKDWNSDPDPDPEYMKEQVKWELKYLRHCPHIFMNFCSGTKSPITLLEFGILMGYVGDDEIDPPTIIVCCPDDFWRVENVRITFDYFSELGGRNFSPQLQLHNNFNDGFGAFVEQMKYVQ